MGVVKNNRIFYYDVIRVIAIFCVISCHVFSGYAKNITIFGTNFWHFSLFFYSLADIGVPLFVILSGALLINKKESIITFAKKRIARVIFPYLFWGVLFIICALIFKEYGHVLLNFSNVQDLIFSVFSIQPRGSAVFFWFVPMILLVYGVIFAINSLSEYFEPALKVSLLISILVIILLNFNIIPYIHPYNYIFYSIFAIMGYYLANFDFLDNKISSRHLCIIFALIFFISYILEISINASISLSLHQAYGVSKFSWINLASIISLFLSIRYLLESYEIYNYGAKNIAHGVANKISKIVFSISACSYGIYLSHIIVVNLLLNFILCLLKSHVSVSFYSTLTLILTFICSWMLIFILDKIPYLRNIIGTSH